MLSLDHASDRGGRRIQLRNCELLRRHRTASGLLDDGSGVFLEEVACAGQGFS